MVPQYLVSTSAAAHGRILILTKCCVFISLSNALNLLWSWEKIYYFEAMFHWIWSLEMATACAIVTICRTTMIVFRSVNLKMWKLYSWSFEFKVKVEGMVTFSQNYRTLELDIIYDRDTNSNRNCINSSCCESWIWLPLSIQVTWYLNLESLRQPDNFITFFLYDVRWFYKL